MSWVFRAGDAFTVVLGDAAVGTVRLGVNAIHIRSVTPAGRPDTTRGVESPIFGLRQTKLGVDGIAQQGATQ